MAIALDTSAVSTDQTSSPLTWNHTCTGANGILVVGVIATAGSSQPSTSAVTYGGVSMTKARADQVTASTQFMESSVWILHNPLQGSNQISATIAGGSGPHNGGASTSFIGAQQSDTADAVNGKTGNATGDQTFTVTTVKDNCWIFVIGANVALSGPTMTADQTSRQTLSMSAAITTVLRSEDTNAAQTPAGAKTVGMTTGAGLTEDGYTMSAASFAPANTGTQVNNYQSASASDSNAGILSMTERVR